MKAICDWIDALPLTNAEIVIIVGLVCLVMMYPYRSGRSS